ncbi:MAG: hypothetical protein RQ758_05975 [Methanomicrobiaceae archaeon]|nr:hypothetical protein [Methanomicrobiaceae archaeon]
MDHRMRDAGITVGSVLLFIVCLVILPMLPLNEAYAYLAAIALFIIVMAAAGFQFVERPSQ